MLQFHIVKALLPDMDGFPSGQRGQTVNLLQFASVVRIHLHPFARCGLRVAMRPLVCEGWLAAGAGRSLMHG